MKAQTVVWRTILTACLPAAIVYSIGREFRSFLRLARIAARQELGAFREAWRSGPPRKEAAR
jgi:hypothetical protein